MLIQTIFAQTQAERVKPNVAIVHDIQVYPNYNRKLDKFSLWVVCKLRSRSKTILTYLLDIRFTDEPRYPRDRTS
jgi:hypothetical protein